MSEPWEDFAGGATSVATTSKPTQATAGGDTLPWEDFAQASSQGGVRLSSATPRLDRAAEVFNKAMAYSPFALQESTNEWPTLATAFGIRPGPAQGPAAAMEEVTKQGNVLNLATLAALPEAVLTKLPAAVKALIATYFAKTAAEQAGTAAGHISVEGLPKLPVSPMSIDVPIGQALMGQPQAAQDFGGTTEQWRNLGEVVNSLLGVAGAGGVLRGTGRVPSGLEPIDIESHRTLQDLPITTPERPTTQVTGFPWEDFGGQPTTVPPSRQLEAGQPTRFEAPQEGPATKFYSGLNVDPEKLRPAIRYAGRLFVGERGDTHKDVVERNGLPKEIDHFSPASGFALEGATKPEDFLDRKQAEQATGIKGDAAAGGLDSQQLPGAAMHRLERMMRQHDQESQRRLQSGQSQREESRSVQEQGGSTEAASPGGVLQTSQIGKDIYGQREQQVQLRQPYTEQSVTGQSYPGQLGEAAQSEAGLPPVRGADQRGQAGEERRTKGYVRGRGIDDRQTSYGSGVQVPSLEEIKDVFTPKARLLLRSPEQLKLKTEGQVDAGQLVNRLLNTVPGGEKETLEAAGIREAFKPGQKASVGEVDEWVKENGPKVEVRKLEALPQAQDDNLVRLQQRNDITHRLETRGYHFIDPNHLEVPGQGTINIRDYLRDAPEQDRALINEIIRLDAEGDYSYRAQGNESATARYTMVNPKPLDQMPGAVDLLVRIPTKRLKDVTPEERAFQRRTGMSDEETAKYTSSHYPTEGRNLLAHVRGYMETDAQGRKVFHVFEVQSDWAQRARELKEEVSKSGPIQGGISRGELENINDPLLRHYERLALKAAIEHARSQGADAIAISDAETAMMTEGHDRAAALVEPVGINSLLHGEYEPTQHWGSDWRQGKYVRVHHGAPYDVRIDKPEANIYGADIAKAIAQGGYGKDKAYIPQAQGMRLHYDRTLPKIAEELIGQKGERVEFGEHQNAFESKDRSGAYVIGADEATYRKQRPDLIFRNPDGTPKTTITARQYSLEKTGPPPYSTTGSRLYSGIPLPELEKVWDGMKKWFKGPVADTKDWSPLRDPAAMRQEILESKTATPITSKQAGVKLPTEGPDTTLGDRIINSQNDIAKKWAAVRDLGSKVDKLITPFDVFLDMADGGKGTFRNPLIRNIRWTTDYDFNVELNQQEKLLKPVDQALKENEITRKNGIRTGIYSAVQQGLRDRMIKNGIPATYIDNVVKTFSPAEKRAYDVSQRLYNETFPALQSLAKDLLGVDLQKINNYSPIHSDWRDVKKPPELIKPGGGKEAVEDDLLNFFQGDFRQGGTKTAQGFLEPRLPNAETMMNLDYYDVYKRHMKDVAHFLSSQRRLSELAKIVRDPKFEEKYGDVTQKLVMDWLNNYAKQGRSISAVPGLNTVRKAVAKGVLGFRVSSQLVHLANVPLGLQRAGPGNYARGLQFAMSEAGQEFLHKNLAETFERGGGEIELLEKQGPFAKAAFRPQRELDKWNSQATALGVYLRENGTFDGPVNQKALAIARVETRRAVASPLYKDLPPLLRNQAGKIIGQFQNTFMDQWSNIRYDLPQYLRNDPKKAMGLFVALSGMVLVESGIKYEEKKLRHQLEGYHPKTDLDDTYQKKVAEEALKRLPGYNQAAANLEYGSTGVPLIDMIKEGAKTARDLYVATRDEDKTGQKLGGLRAATMAAEGLGVVGSGYGGQIAQEVMKGRLFKPHSQRMQEVADKAGLDLSDFDQRLASEAYLKETREPMTKEESTRAAIAAEKNQLERWKGVMNNLSKEDRQWLKTNKIEPPGFGDYLEQAKIRVPYTDAENKFATEMYKSEYETVISFLRNDAGFKQLSGNEQQLVANEAFRDAAKRAREQTEEVVKSGALVEKPKKKKRFSAFAPE